MTPLEELFRCEVESHMRLRTEASAARADAAAAHTSFALQNQYEELMRAAAGATGRDIETMRERLTLLGDPRDVLSARDSVKSLLGIPSLDS